MLTVAVVMVGVPAPLGSRLAWMTHVPFAPFTCTELPEIEHGPDRTVSVVPAVTPVGKVEPYPAEAGAEI